MDFGWDQIQGAREYQQDAVSILSWPNGEILVVVADGMGGMASGDVASVECLTVFNDKFIEDTKNEIQHKLLVSLENANAHLTHLISTTPEYEGMGTTLASAYLKDHQLFWLSVGDSPIWLFRDNVVKRLNQDHSMVPVLDLACKKGKISEQQALSSPQRNQLRSAVQGEDIDLYDLSEPFTLFVNDIVIIASDGLDSLTKDEMSVLLAKNLTLCAESIVTELLEAVSNKNITDQDNTSVAVIKVI